MFAVPSTSTINYFKHPAAFVAVLVDLPTILRRLRHAANRFLIITGVRSRDYCIIHSFSSRFRRYDRLLLAKTQYSFSGLRFSPFPSSLPLTSFYAFSTLYFLRKLHLTSQINLASTDQTVFAPIPASSPFLYAVHSLPGTLVFTLL